MALIDEQNKLNEMYRKIPDQVDAMSENIGQLEDIRDELAEQTAAIEDAVLDVTEADLTIYLSTIKLIELSILWPPVPGVFGPLLLTFGPNYGAIDYATGGITDWQYTQVNLVFPFIPPFFVRYVYTPAADPQIDQWVNDYAYSNNYLTKPLDTGGTYGLYENIIQINTGLGVLNANKNAVAAGEAVFSRYLP